MDDLPHFIPCSTKTLYFDGFKCHLLANAISTIAIRLNSSVVFGTYTLRGFETDARKPTKRHSPKDEVKMELSTHISE